MDLETARFLASAAGRDLLDAARATRGVPAHRRGEALGPGPSPARIRTVLVQDDLRVRARARCPHAEAMLFTREALEQATAWPVAAERATRWEADITRPLVDLTAGIGLDALATAATGREVVAYERDAARALLLGHNAAALGLADRIVIHAADVLEARPTGPLALLDPGRREGGRRTRRVEAFAPPADAWAELLAPFERALLKLPPVVEGPLPVPGSAEWVSLDGRLRELRLRTGDWDARPPRRALRLPGGEAVEGEGLPWPEAGPVGEGDWLFDPDPAVTVAGLVGDLARQRDLRPIHPRIAYLRSEAPRAGLPGAWIHVEARLPVRPKAVQAWLAAVGGARPVVRTRGTAVRAEAFARRLRDAGPAPTTLVLTRDARDRWMALAGRSAPMTLE